MIKQIIILILFLSLIGCTTICEVEIETETIIDIKQYGVSEGFISSTTYCIFLTNVTTHTFQGSICNLDINDQIYKRNPIQTNNCTKNLREGYWYKE